MKKEIQPGQTVDTKYKSWNIRYQLKPSNGSNVYKAMATHSKSKKMSPITGQAIGAELVLNLIKNHIDSMTGTKQFTRDGVNVSFNVQLARDIIGHNEFVYSDVVKSSGKSYLLISDTQFDGSAKAHNRLPGKEQGQQSLGISKKKAIEVGLTNSRYTIGDITSYNGIPAYELVFHSEVFEGENIELGIPGVTVS